MRFTVFIALAAGLAAPALAQAPDGSATAANRAPTTWSPPTDTLAARTWPFSQAPPEKVATSPDALSIAVSPSTGAMNRQPPAVYPASARPWLAQAPVGLPPTT